MENKGGYPHPQAPPAYGVDTQQNNAYPMHAYQPPTVIEQQQVHIIHAAPAVGPNPTMVTCPSCHGTVVTRMEFEASTKTHLFAGILCLLGCWCCCCIPYCVDSCQNGNHYCPSCGAYIGTYSG